MSDRVVVFFDWQNVYKGAREAFHSYGDPHWCGQVDPVRIAQALAADSPFDRELTEVRIYRGRPDNTRDPKGYAACARQVASWPQPVCRPRTASWRGTDFSVTSQSRAALS